MNLGTRQQDTIHGDDYQNPPGAFPETPSETPHESGKHHNKLHKPNDPRGWSQSEREARGYGLMDDTTTTTPMGANLPSQTERTVGYDNRDSSDSSLRRGTSPSRTTDYSHNTPHQGSTTTTGIEARHKHGHEDAGRHGLGTSATGAADVSPRAGEQNHSQTGIPPVADTNEHPYWGDLPVGGTVYNTVTGHGSHEDDEIRRRVAKKDESSLGSTIPTKSDNVHTSSHHYETQPQGDHIGHGHSHTHAPGHVERSREGKDLHRGEGVAGSAYAYDQHKHRDTIRQNPEEHAQEKKENKGILGTILGLAGSKNDDSDKEEQHARAEKEHKTKEHKDHGPAGIFHHGTKQDESRRDEPRRAPRQDERLSKNDGAFAPIGARTAFGAAPSSHVDETRHRPASSQYEQPTPQERVGYDGLLSGAVSGIRTRETESPYTRDASSPDSYKQRRDDHHHDSDDEGTDTVIGAVGLGTGAFAYGSSRRDDLIEGPITNTSSTVEPLRDSQVSHSPLPSNTYGTTTTTDRFQNTHDSYNPLASTINTTSTTSTREPFQNTQTSYGQHPADTYTTGATTTTAPFRDTEDSYNPPPSNTYGTHTTATDPFKDNQALYNSLPSDAYNTRTTTSTDRSRNYQTTYEQPLSSTYGVGTSGTADRFHSTDASSSYDLSSSNTYGIGTTDRSREPRDAISPNVVEPTHTPATGFPHPRGDHDHHSAVAENKHHGDSSQTKPTPALAEHANNAEYNLLASGTPSGVRIDDD